MTWRRTLPAALGVAALAFGLTAAGDGPFAAVVSAGVETLGNDYLFLAALAGAGVPLAAAMLASGRAGNLEQAETPDPERPPVVPAVGEEFDERVHSLRFKLPVVGRSTRRAVRDRLRTAAVEATVRAEGCSRAEAARRVTDGTWTDDRTVAAFLTGESGFSPPHRHLTALADGETLDQRRVRRAVEEIVARSNEGTTAE